MPPIRDDKKTEKHHERRNNQWKGRSRTYKYCIFCCTYTHDTSHCRANHRGWRRENPRSHSRGSSSGEWMSQRLAWEIFKSSPFVLNTPQQTQWHPFFHQLRNTKMAQPKQTPKWAVGGGFKPIKPKAKPNPFAPPCKENADKAAEAASSEKAKVKQERSPIPAAVVAPAVGESREKQEQPPRPRKKKKKKRRRQEARKEVLKEGRRRHTAVAGGSRHQLISESPRRDISLSLIHI